MPYHGLVVPWVVLGYLTQHHRVGKSCERPVSFWSDNTAQVGCPQVAEASLATYVLALRCALTVWSWSTHLPPGQAGDGLELRSFHWCWCHSWTKIYFQILTQKHWMGTRGGRKERGGQEGERICSFTAASLSLSHGMHSLGPLIPAFLFCHQPIFLLRSAFLCKHFTHVAYTLPHKHPFPALTVETLL